MAGWPARKAVVPWLRMLLIFAVVASLVEFVLLRLILRGGAFAPPGVVIDRVFDLLLAGGLAALNFAFLTASVALALVAFLLFRGGTTKRAAALLIWSLLAVGFLLLLHPMMPLLYPGLFVALAVPLLFLFPRKRSWDFLAACTIAVALGSTFYFQASLNAASMRFPLPYANEIFSGGEVLAVAAPFLLLPGRHWKLSFVPLAAFPAVLYVLVSNSAFVSLAAVWTVYFTLFLPAPIYALALGAAAYSLADLLSDKPQRWMGVGFLLIAITGRMFQSTYLAQISLLGLILFVLPASVLGLMSGEKARSADLPGRSGLRKVDPSTEA